MVNNMIAIKSDKEYREWVAELSQRYQKCQIKAASSVNREMLLFYWTLGRDVAKMKAKSRWGSGFLRQLSSDLKHALPNVKGLSFTNLVYMVYFYRLYPDLEIYPQLGEKTQDEIYPQVEDKLESNIVKTNNILSELVFSIPWGHHKLIIDKCGKDQDKAKFYVQETVKNNWSRAVLLNWLDTDLYERQGKAVTNFFLTLPAPQSDLAQEITKDPYNFDFLSIRARYDEKEFKDALMENVQRLLMELGSGFAFVGREYRLVVGKTEQFIDLLFYNFRLHCFVVVEVKVSAFDPRDMGQLSTYVAAVDGILRSKTDAPTIGLLICKTKDNVLAQYAANVIKAPVGISEYQLANLLKDEFKGTLPTIEEIESGLKM